jgi:hypothetical protein
VRAGTYISNRLPFAVDALPECLSSETNHSQAAAQSVTLPVIVNGRIGQPGRWDVFRFHGRAGEEMVAEVIARRLDSPLDSVIRLTDAAGRQLAFNDDYEDKGAGLQTQSADSYFRVKLPADGDCFLWLGDAQNQGGPEYSYRLRLSPPRPDFALRIAPSSLSVRGGMSVPLTVYALRRDGFSNEITLLLQDAPAGFTLSGTTVPANEDQVRLTLTAPPMVTNEPFNLAVEGFARIGEQPVLHAAIPAENRMQAFAYWHLVPSKQLEVTLVNRGQTRVALTILDPACVNIPAGGTAVVRVRIPGPAFTNNFDLELDAPPDGISLEKISAAGTQAEITLRSDAAKIKPGAKGNLIVNITNKSPQQPARAGAPARANQKPPVLGTLPAIPFEIVPPQVSSN